MSLAESINNLIATHRRRLQLLKEKKAKYGLNTPSEIIIEIEDIEAEIEQLELELKEIERSVPSPKEPVSNGVAIIHRARKSLANILRISLNQISIQSERSKLWRIQLPATAAERLLTLHQNTDPILQTLNIQQLRVIRHQPPQPPASLPQGLPGKSTKPNGTQNHPLQISLAGKAVAGVKNELQLVVNNLSAEDYRQVSVQLEMPHNGISLRPAEIDFPLQANSNASIPITLLASRAGLQKIEVWASSVPAPRAGFLHQTLSLFVELPPAKSIIEVELT